MFPWFLDFYANEEKSINFHGLNYDKKVMANTHMKGLELRHAKTCLGGSIRHVIPVIHVLCEANMSAGNIIDPHDSLNISKLRSPFSSNSEDLSALHN